MNKHKGLLALLCLFPFSGCVTLNPALDNPQLTQLQVRAIQTRTYDALDYRKTLKTVLNVLQDEGYLVDYAAHELGLLNASKEFIDPQYSVFDLSSSLLEPNQNGSLIKVTANISELGKYTKVRVNFQKSLGNFANGTISESKTVTDPKFYQEFFAKLDKALFIENQGLE